MSEELPAFALPDGAPFARVLETRLGQVVATLETNDDGNAAIVLRRWTRGAGLQVVVSVQGGRAPQTDEAMIAGFEVLTAEKAANTIESAFSEPSE